MDASLKEITNLVKEVHPESRKKGTIFDFAICYQVFFLQICQNIFKTVSRQAKNLKILGQSFATIQSKRDRTDCIWQKIIG